MRVLHLTTMFPLSMQGLHSGGHAVYHLVEALRLQMGADSQDVWLFRPPWAQFYHHVSSSRRQNELYRSDPFVPYLRFRDCLTLPTGLFDDVINPAWQRASILPSQNGERYDVLHVHTPRSLGLLASRMSAKWQLPFIATVRRDMAQWQQQHVLRKRAIHHCLERATAIVAPSPVLARCTQEATGRLPSVIANGTSALFNEDPPREKVRYPYRILFVGTLDENKAVTLLVKTVLDLLAQGTPVELVIVGTGPLENHVRTLAAGHAEIRLLGWQSQEQVRDHMREAQVLCVVSYSETFGIVYAEAMKQGTAVVARAGTGIDGMGEDHKHYELISRDADLKPLLKNLLEHPAHCRLIAERGRELGRAWSWELSAQRLHELYRKCL